MEQSGERSSYCPCYELIECLFWKIVQRGSFTKKKHLEMEISKSVVSPSNLDLRGQISDWNCRGLWICADHLSYAYQS